ncbi:MAG: hypothetical protein AAF715_13380 [Myxococcota bacterium]
MQPSVREERNRQRAVLMAAFRLVAAGLAFNVVDTIAISLRQLALVFIAVPPELDWRAGFGPISPSWTLWSLLVMLGALGAKGWLVFRWALLFSREETPGRLLRVSVAGVAAGVLGYFSHMFIPLVADHGVTLVASSAATAAIIQFVERTGTLVIAVGAVVVLYRQVQRLDAGDEKGGPYRASAG